MKRLAKSLVVSLFLIPCFMAITVAHAQSVDRAVETRDNRLSFFKSEALKVFTATEKELASTKTLYVSKLQQEPSNKDRNSKAITAIGDAVTALGLAKTTYLTNLDKLGATSLEPSQAQIQSLRLAEEAFNKQRLVTQGYADIENIIFLFKSKISGSLATQALLVDRGTLTPNTPESDKYSNADPFEKQGGIDRKAITDDDPAKCEITKFSLTSCVDVLLAFIVKAVAISFATWFAAAAAGLLDYAIIYGIRDFGQLVTDQVYPIWDLTRRVVSLFVMFASVWAGVMYIAGKQQTLQRVLPGLILFALCVNLSYPALRFVIDMSNKVSYTIYVSTIGEDVASGKSNMSASTMLMSLLKLQAVTGDAVKPGSSTASLKDVNSTPAALLVLIFICYTAYFLFMWAILLVVRTLVLALSIIGSSLLLVDTVVPWLGPAAQKFRSLFLHQLILGPISFLMFYVTIRMMQVISASGFSAPEGWWSSSQNIQVYFKIVIMLGLLHLMLKITRQVSGDVGQAVTGWAGKIGGFATGAAVGLATGGTGLVARSTLGAYAARLRDSDRMNALQNTRTGRFAKSLTNSLANSSYDVRNTSGVQKMAGMAGMGGGLGKGIDTYQSSFDKRQKEAARRFNAIKVSREKKDADGNVMLDERGRAIMEDIPGGREAREAYREQLANSGVGNLFTKGIPGTLKDTLRQEFGGLRKASSTPTDEKIFESLWRSDGKILAGNMDKYAKRLKRQEAKENLERIDEPSVSSSSPRASQRPSTPSRSTPLGGGSIEPGTGAATGAAPIQNTPEPALEAATQPETPQSTSTPTSKAYTTSYKLGQNIGSLRKKLQGYAKEGAANDSPESTSTRAA